MLHILSLTFLLSATAVTPLGMGLSLPTTLRVCLPSATCRAPTTCTTILLRSLADPEYVSSSSPIPHLDLFTHSGVFDIPNAKCPPDRGSSDCVTGGLAPIISQSPDSSFSPSPPEKSTSPINNHITSARIPIIVPSRYIPARSESPCGLVTPPLTPDDSDASGAHGIFAKHSKDALDLLLNIFPRNGLSILPFAKSVVVSVPNMGATFDGVVLELPGNSKTFYVDGKNASAVNLRER